MCGNPCFAVQLLGSFVWLPGHCSDVARVLCVTSQVLGVVALHWCVVARGL